MAQLSPCPSLCSAKRLNRSDSRRAKADQARVRWGYTLALPDKYGGSICAPAAAMRPVATIAVIASPKQLKMSEIEKK